MYLLFYKGTKKENPNSTFWDRAICVISRSRFSHIEIAFDKAGATYDCISSSLRDGGVREKWIDTSSGRWIIFEIPNNNEMTIREWLRTKLGKRYDIIGLIGTVIKLPIFSSIDKWFCSEIIAEALEIDDSWKYSPETLYKLFNK